MTIARITPPNLEYLADDVFEGLGFSQIVKAGDTTHISGIAPLTGPIASLEIQSPGDVAGQIAFVLDVLDRSLIAAGTTRESLVNIVVYSTDLVALGPHLSLIADFVGDHRPTSTTLGVAALIHPDQQIEISAIAYTPEG